MVWYGLAIGAIIGGGAGDDPPGNSNPEGGIGGTKNSNSDEDSKKGGQGLFSLWGHEVWLYIGGILGFGESFGPYITTGPMIGSNPDWALGGGVHIGKAFGLGMVIPLRQAFSSANKHSDKVGMLLDQGQQCLNSVGARITNTCSLDQIISSPENMTAVICVGALALAGRKLPDYDVSEKVTELYVRATNTLLR
jgi:hypothetical protein